VTDGAWATVASHLDGHGLCNRHNSMNFSVLDFLDLCLITIYEVQICIWPSRCHCHSLSLAPVNTAWFYLPGFTFLVPAYPCSPDNIQKSHKTIVIVFTR